MTTTQVTRFARIVSDLSELRDECDAADRFELGVLILECAGTLSRPVDHEPEPTGTFDDCIR